MGFFDKLFGKKTDKKDDSTTAETKTTAKKEVKKEAPKKAAPKKATTAKKAAPKKAATTKTDDNVFLVPVEGEIINISEIPDPVFAEKMMGDGFGIKPANGKVFAPTSGEVIAFFPHAVGIKADGTGIEYLVHFGLDTVSLNGEGFDTKVKMGDKVKQGDLILEVDLEEVEPKVPSIITPVIFTNLNGKTFTAKEGNYKAKTKTAVKIK